MTCGRSGRKASITKPMQSVRCAGTVSRIPGFCDENKHVQTRWEVIVAAAESSVLTGADATAKRGTHEDP